MEESMPLKSLIISCRLEFTFLPMIVKCNFTSDPRTNMYAIIQYENLGSPIIMA